MKKLVKKIKDTSKGIFSSRKGFTLLELLVVVLIIGILVAIALPQYKRVKEKTIMAEGMQLAKQIAEANQRYYLMHGEYAEDINNLDINFSGQLIVLYDINRIETNNFIIATMGSSKTTMATIQRKPFATLYSIYIPRTNPNNFGCYLYSTATKIQKELCDKLNSDGHL